MAIGNRQLRRNGKGAGFRSGLRFEVLEKRRLLAGDDGGGGAAAPLLPDLIAWESEERGYVHGWAVIPVGRNRLQINLTTAVANIGVGPLELIGSTPHPDGTQDVLQRIYNDDDTFTDRLAGQFVYHASHGHVHFAGFAEYALREVLAENGVGDIVATGGKTSFCLVDLDDYDATIPGAPDEGRYHTCGSGQGISVGWADIYGEYLPDQWIDVTNVPAGQYWLEVTVDPDNYLQELDETNNAVRLLIDYSPPTNATGDAREPDDDPDDNNHLGNATSTQFDNLSIHAPGNEDFFRWIAPRDGVLAVETRFTHDDGDLNLFVYEGRPEEIGLSISETNTERVTVRVTAGHEYYIKVIGAGSDTNPDYSFSLSFGEDGGPGTVFDAFEPNNDRARATLLPSVDQFLDELNIHSAVDEDHFRWNAPATGPLTISTDFAQAAGNIDLYVYNIAGILVAASAGDGDGESVTLDAYAGQIYFIKVEGRGLDVNPSYALTLDGPEPVLGDTDLDNDVDLTDLNNVRNHFGEAGNVLGDANGDGKVDLEDLNAVRNNFGAGAPSPAPRRAAPRSAFIAAGGEELRKSSLPRVDRRVDLLFTSVSDTAMPVLSVRAPLASRRLKAVDRVFAVL